MFLRTGDGSRIQLGAQIAKAGEGTVYHVVGRPRYVAKVFHPGLEDLARKTAKVRAMAAIRPAEAVQRNGFVVLAWPEDYLADGSGQLCGFLMRKLDVSKSVEIHAISNPADRADPVPTGPQWPRGFTWTHLLRVGVNLCVAVERVHQAGAVIGDFNERNILVSETSLVSLVDCDSFQFSEGGRTHTCAVGRPEFLAPELEHVDLRGHVRQRSSDLFVLAVHLHLLLMAGNHPFQRGHWTGPGEMPEPLELARGGHWAGGATSRLTRHAAAPSPDMLPVPIRRLFERAFGSGARNPSLRPTAQDWYRELNRVSVVTCGRDRMHTYPREQRSCPWCALDRARAPATRPATRTPAPSVIDPPLAKPAPPSWYPASTPSAPPKPSARGLRWRLDRWLLLAAGVAILTGDVPSGIGHRMLRDYLLRPSPEVYDPGVRAGLSYLWTEILSGWAVLAAVVAIVLAAPPWRGRRFRILLAAGLAGVTVVTGVAGRAMLEHTEAAAVDRLSTTAFPFGQRFQNCGDGFEIITAESRTARPVRWQLQRGATREYSGQGCNQLNVYAGWHRVGWFNLPAGVEFASGADDLAVGIDGRSEPIAFGDRLIAFDPGLVRLSARTTDGRSVSVTLRDVESRRFVLR